MFYFLFILGVSLIVFGIYKEKDNLLIFIEEKQNKVELNELNHLNKRVENIERILFFSEPYIDVEEEIVHESEEISNSPSFQEELDELPQNSYEKYELILKYEKENYSLEEICSLLNMKKGEVLLLKNLYKTYKI